MLEFLPQFVKDSLSRLNIAFVYEIRIRAEKPVTVNYKGEYTYLGDYGVTPHREKAIRCSMEDIADCVFKAGKYSVYSVEEQIKKGFLTAENGERIGLSGEYVYEKGQPLAIRNFTSLCIRVPHEIIGCAREVYKQCMSDRVQNLLLMSPPGLGKTTILRDLARLISENTRKNILICDERGEISVGELGDTCDVIRFCDKQTAFEAGVRAMRPDLIITDELLLKDCEALQKAVFAGVAVVASAHFSDMEFVGDPFIKIFDRFVLLDGKEIGKIRRVFDRNGKVI